MVLARCIGNFPFVIVAGKERLAVRLHTMGIFIFHRLDHGFRIHDRAPPTHRAAFHIWIVRIVIAFDFAVIKVFVPRQVLTRKNVTRPATYIIFPPRPRNLIRFLNPEVHV